MATSTCGAAVRSCWTSSGLVRSRHWKVALQMRLRRAFDFASLMAAALISTPMSCLPE